MSNLFYIMGKSATGKDTIYKRIKENLNVKEYILYTTRPKRDGEKEGIDYHYITSKQMEQLEKENKVIESRTYNTVHGPWTYATIEDEQLKQDGDILTVGTLESYAKIKEYFQDRKDTKVLPIYIAIDEKERRKRAIAREQKQKEPKFQEMERRLNADNIDFSDENLRKVGISSKETFYNYNLEKVVNQILNYIEKESKEIEER